MSRSTFTLPALIAALSLLGLLAGLCGDGCADWIAWAGLGAPLAALAWACCARRC